MLLTISTTYQPATDLGFLLHKNPERFQTFDLSFGQAHVFYPYADAGQCEAALFVEIDPIALARGKPGGPDGFALQQYVNDRPYAASSFLSVAIAQVFGTALGGRCNARPDLAQLPIPLEAHVAALPAREGEELIHRLFAPLGYEVRAIHGVLDSRFPEWGDAPYFDVVLRGTVRLRALLSHLYVLIPVLDEEKHYWVGPDEIEKLLHHGRDWLPAHPERTTIANRYLARQYSLTREALERLSDTGVDPNDNEVAQAQDEEVVEESISLHEQRHGAVLTALRASGAHSVLDLGCGEGRLLGSLLRDQQFERITGMDVSHRVLERATRRLHLDQMPDRQRERITLLHGSLTYRDRRLEGYDAAVVVEVIEHLELARLAVFERILFEFTRPGCVIVTTPNREYNVAWATLLAGTFRHHDHRFEWTRAEFHAWATAVSDRFGYTVRFLPVGSEHPEHGPPTQMGVFSRA